VSQRSQWSRGAGRRLLDAVRLLAAEWPIHQVSVAALCHRAGLTRDTFYRYAARPVDVLARAMDDDLPSADVLLGLIAPPPAADPLEAPGRAVLEHIDRNKAIYQHALHPHLDSALREVLIGRLETLLSGYLQSNPESVPTIGDTNPTGAETRRLAVFTAAGTVGAIENWLAQDQPEPVDRMLTLLFTAAAPWWRRPDGRSGSRPRTDDRPAGPRVTDDRHRVVRPPDPQQQDTKSGLEGSVKSVTPSFT
jgi:AcrR family transcriptional regulator